MKENNLLLSPKVHRVTQHGKEYTDAYVFVKQLQSSLIHPILLNFKVNKDAHRLRLRIGSIKFSRLLKAAISHGLCRYEGDNLRFISHTQERHLLKCKSAMHYEPVKQSDILQYIQIQILKKIIKKQNKAIKYKQQSTATKRAANVKPVNYLVTLSCRSVAHHLNLKSHTHANNLLKKLSGFGLVLTQNRTEISEGEYRFYNRSGAHNARLDTETGKFYFLHANSASFKPFYRGKGTGTAFYANDYW